MLSDSFAASTLFLWLNRCPGIPEQARVTASCVGASGGSSGASLLVAVTQAGGGESNAASLSCEPASWGVRIPLTVTVGAAFRSPGGSATLSCALTGSDRSSMGSFRVAATVLPTLWPLFHDAVVVLKDGSMRSSLLGTVNGTNALLEQSCQSLTPLAAARNASVCTLQVTCVCVWGGGGGLVVSERVQ
jgi:hypothetical protein